MATLVTAQVRITLMTLQGTAVNTLARVSIVKQMIMGTNIARKRAIIAVAIILLVEVVRMRVKTSIVDLVIMLTKIAITVA